MRAFLFLLAVFLLAEGGYSFLYTKENKYASILKEHGHEIGDMSGSNLKISDESVNGLVDKVVDSVRSDIDNNSEEEIELNTNLFNFEDNSDMEEFEDVDLTNWKEDSGFSSSSEENSEDEEEPMMTLDGTVVTTKFKKWAGSYSRAFAVDSNGTKSFWKVHQSTTEGGQITSKISGSADTKLVIQSSGTDNGAGKTTVYYKGKEYKIKGSSESKLNIKETDQQVGKSNKKWVSLSNISVSSSIHYANKTIPITIKVSSGSETFQAPFRIFLTLFESKWDVSGAGDSNLMSESGKSIGGTVKGEVTSRVVFSKKGTSLTKSTIRGFVISEGEKYCSVKMFKIWSHVWTKPAKKEDVSSESGDYDEEAGSINIQVSTYSKGRVYEKISVGKKAKAFAGSGVAAFEKSTVTVPKTGDHLYGVNYIVKNMLQRHMTAWRNPTENMQF